MKITKAIEILTDVSNAGPIPDPQDHRDALKLGIEALKLIKLHRRHPQGLSFALLPGEEPETAPTRSLHHIKDVLESPLGKEPR